MDISTNFQLRHKLAPMSFDFLKAPFDVRRMIYKQLFRGAKLRPRQSCFRAPGFSAILHTNQEIRNEALPLFYALATFVLRPKSANCLQCFDLSLSELNSDGLPISQVHKRMRNLAIKAKAGYFQNWKLAGSLQSLASMNCLQINYAICSDGYQELEVLKQSFRYRSTHVNLPWSTLRVLRGSLTHEEEKALRVEFARMELLQVVRVARGFITWTRRFNQYKVAVTMNWYIPHMRILHHEIKSAGGCLALPGVAFKIVFSEHDVEIMEDIIPECEVDPSSDDDSSIDGTQDLPMNQECREELLRILKRLLTAD